MKKYLSLIYIAFSAMAFGQFQDNVFDKEKIAAQQQQTESVTPMESDDVIMQIQPGTPGEPVPIDDYLPWLLFGGMAIVIYSQRKNKEINI